MSLLNSEKERDDGRLKSIFWPTVENAWDVDHLGRQGFWLCLIIAALQIIVSIAHGTPNVIISGLVGASIYVIGAMGVRESSWPAAALIFAIYSLNLIYGIASSQFPGVLTIIATGILLASVRGAFIASRWKPASPEEDRPTRFSETLADRIVDQLPAKAWPVLRIPFFVLASLVLLLSFIGLCVLMLHHPHSPLAQ